MLILLEELPHQVGPVLPHHFLHPLGKTGLSQKIVDFPTSLLLQLPVYPSRLVAWIFDVGKNANRIREALPSLGWMGGNKEKQQSEEGKQK